MNYNFVDRNQISQQVYGSLIWNIDIYIMEFAELFQE